MEADLLLGADVGGTSTRIGLATCDGSLLAVERGGPGNPNAVGTDPASAEIASVLGRCLIRAGLDRDALARIGSAVVGIAGSSALDDPPGFLAAALPGVDPDRIRLVSDFAVAFGTGTPEPDGYVLLAGTGAGAVEIAGGRVVRRHDGWGWLLGDRGSAFWLGREAARATAASLQAGTAAADLGPLGREVLARTSAESYESLLAAVYRQPPIGLAALAPAVGRTAPDDPVAAAIAARAARLLIEGLGDLGPRPGRPVVITGAVLTTAGPVRDAVLAALSGLDHPIGEAPDGVAGALWLARGRAGSDRSADGPPDPGWHARLTARMFPGSCG